MTARHVFGGTLAAAALAGCGTVVTSAPPKLDEQGLVYALPKGQVQVQAQRRRVEADEVDAAKNQVKGQIVLDLEDPGMRLMRLGTRALFGEKIIGVNEGLARIDGVTTDMVCDLAEEVLTSPAVEVVVGPSEEGA